MILSSGIPRNICRIALTSDATLPILRVDEGDGNAKENDNAKRKTPSDGGSHDESPSRLPKTKEIDVATLYKLTNENAQTYGGCQWGPGVEHTASGEGELCSRGWLHAYSDPLVAIFANPIHANFTSPRLWEAEGYVGKRDGPLKLGCTRLRTMVEMELPPISMPVRVRVAITCAKTVYRDPAWNRWADSWLSGEDRSAAAAAAAEAEAEAAAAAAAWAAKAWAAGAFDLAAIIQQAIRDEDQLW